VTQRPAAKKRKKTQDPIDLTIASIDSELSSLKKSFMDQPEDEHHTYAMSLAAKLRKLTDYQAAMARKEIEMILFNIQYSCPPNPPPMHLHPFNNQPHLPAQPHLPNQSHLPIQPHLPSQPLDPEQQSEYH
jgi:hypothetical protein